MFGIVVFGVETCLVQSFHPLTLSEERSDVQEVLYCT